MDVRFVSQRPLNPYEMSEVAKLISAHIREIQSHYFEDGIYIVKRRAKLPPGSDHYGIAFVGRHVKYYNPSFISSVVIHKTDQPRRQCDPFNPLEWERVEKISEECIEQVIHRMIISWDDPYYLLSDNCEHWVRFVATGVKESFQVQNLVKVGVVGTLAYFLLRDDH